MNRVLIFGTFDGIHAGHRHFFAQARALCSNPYLIASLARDENVTRIKSRPAYDPELIRLAAVSAEPLIDEAVLGSLADYIAHIVSLKPDIIALGYDQHNYTDGLAEKLAEVGCTPRIVRCEAHHPEIYKSSKLRSRG